MRGFRMWLFVWLAREWFNQVDVDKDDNNNVTRMTFSRSEEG